MGVVFWESLGILGRLNKSKEPLCEGFPKLGVPF